MIEDPETLRALRLALEAERTFGLDDLPLGPRAAEARTAAPGDGLTGERRTDAAGPRDAAPPSLASLAEEIASCRACGLCETRAKTVPGQGAARARLMFVGEAPGEQEDRTGLAFVGPAGQLLTKMIEAMGLAREEVFIANVLKCRPPGNRDPRPEEVASCFRFLEEQIDLVRPEVVCALGAHAANNLLGRDDPMFRLRGRVFPYRGARLVPTYHPSYLLRAPEAKRKAWADLQVVMKLLAPGAPESD